VPVRGQTSNLHNATVVPNLYSVGCKAATEFRVRALTLMTVMRCDDGSRLGQHAKHSESVDNLNALHDVEMACIGSWNEAVCAFDDERVGSDRLEKLPTLGTPNTGIRGIYKCSPTPFDDEILAVLVLFVVGSEWRE
jgi:hypothetical protein